MTTTRHASIVFDSAREALDGRGWHLSWWDQDIDATILATAVDEYYTRFTNPSKLTAAVSNKALTSNVATLTTTAAHGFLSGQQVVVSGVGAPFDGNFILQSAGGTTFTYNVTNANVTSTAVSPVGSAFVPQLASQSAVITNKALTSNVVTLTTASNTFRVGDRITVAITGGDAVFDGTYVVTAASATTVSYAKTNANVTSVAAAGSVITEVSLAERLKALYGAAPDVSGYFAAAAQAALIASNTAALAATTAASLVFEGVA